MGDDVLAQDLTRGQFLSMLVAGAAVIALPTPRWLEKVVQETPATKVASTAKITCVDGTVYYAPVVEQIVNQVSEQRHFSVIATKTVQPETIEFSDPISHRHEIGPVVLNSGDTMSITWTLRA